MNAEFIEALGDVFLESFKLLTYLGNGFNYMIAGIMFILAVIWIKKMGDYNREAKQNGTLK